MLCLRESEAVAGAGRVAEQAFAALDGLRRAGAATGRVSGGNSCERGSDGYGDTVLVAAGDNGRSAVIAIALRSSGALDIRATRPAWRSMATSVQYPRG